MTTPFPYKVEFDKDRYHEIGHICDWCENNLGEGGNTYLHLTTDNPVWVIHQMFGKSTFRFKHEKDAALFVLRWV